jgi:signal transduction histidine kinase
VLGFGTILEDGVAGPLTPEQRHYVSKINEGADHLLMLVNDLLDMSRIQAGKFSLAPAPCRLAPVVDEVLAQLAPLAERKRLKLECAVPKDLPELWADEQRVRQILVNLVGNAIKFTEDDGVITVAARDGGACVHVAVADTGIGIDADAQKRLFAPFTQVDMSPTRRAGGTGLGLSITKGLVEAHGGRIGVASEPGCGSTFWFTLPHRADAPPPRWV